MADNFGLAQNTNATLSLSPRIQRNILDFQFRFNLDNWVSGLYAQFNFPVEFAKWQLQCGCGSSSDCCSTSTGTTLGGTKAFNPGYMNHASASGILNAAVTPATTVEQALSGDFTFGDMTTAWAYGRWNFTDCPCSYNKLAAVDMILGYNFWQCEDYHVGLYFRAVAPTGTQLDCCWAQNFFGPISGNGQHWEVGGGLDAHWKVWNCDDESNVTFYLTGDVTTLLNKCQVRSFDFAGKGCLSRYLLLKEFALSGSTYTYNNDLINAINWTTRGANVKVSVKGQAMLKLVYSYCDWLFGIGYEIYGRQAETVCINDNSFCDDTMSNRYFGIKGCTPVAAQGYSTALSGSTSTEQIGLNGTNTITAANKAVTYPAGSFSSTLNATQSNATINGCGTVDSAVNLYTAATSSATAGNGFIYLDTRLVTVGTSGALTINGTAIAVGTTTSVAGLPRAQESATGTVAITTAGVTTGLTSAPTILSNDVSVLDATSGAACRQLSNKVFGDIHYTWVDCDWKPFLGLGAEGEFASSSNVCTLNQWGVYARLGVSF